MKILKTFELFRKKDILPFDYPEDGFKRGDIIKCISTTTKNASGSIFFAPNIIKVGSRCKVLRILGTNLIKVKILDNKKTEILDKKNFILEKDFDLYMSTKKYNL